MKRYRTETDQLVENQISLCKLENEIAAKKYTLEEIGELIPGMLHLNRSEDLVLTQFNSWAEKRFEMTVEEVAVAGMEFMLSRFEPGTAQLFSKSLISFVNNEDLHSCHGFFQKLRFNPKRNFEWVYTSSRLFDKAKYVFSYTMPLGDLENNNRFLLRNLEDNLFLRKNFLKLQSLTIREKQILNLVANGLTTKQIAEQLFVSHHTISTHRKNIGQKLELKSITDWERFVNAFDL